MNEFGLSLENELQQLENQLKIGMGNDKAKAGLMTQFLARPDLERNVVNLCQPFLKAFETFRRLFITLKTDPTRGTEF